MNYIEALKALEEGKVVYCACGTYKKVNGTIKVYLDDEWTSTGIQLNTWMKYEFELVSELLTYKLTFFEAMCEANKGAIVSNEEYPNFRYKMKDGVLHYYENYYTGSTVSIDVDEMKAKWRVVKE